MKTGQAGLNLIKQFEGCRLAAYKCPVGVWTIGYGHTSGVKAGQTITQAQADAFLVSDVERFEANVNKYAGKYNWTQNEFDAMVSFAFNLGSIDKLTANGTRSKTVIAEKILLYNKAAGKELAGLTKRRQAERDLFLSGQNVTGQSTTGQVTRTTIKYGSRGPDVTYLQQRLAAKGYSVGAVDGVFGTKTRAAVMEFQKANGLKADGIVGKNTWSRLLV